METEGKVLRLYPLLGVMQSLLTEEGSLLRCGSDGLTTAYKPMVT